MTHHTRSALSQLSDKIASRLAIIYGDSVSNVAREFITNEIETAEELMDDLDAGHEDSGLVDHIINHTKIKETQAKEIHSLLIQACEPSAVCEDKAPWIDKGVDAVSDYIQQNHSAAMVPLIFDVILKIFENLLERRTEDANMTHREAQLYSIVKTMTIINPLWMLAGYTLCPTTHEMIFDHNNGENIALLRKSHKRLKERQTETTLSSTITTKEPFAIER